MNAEKRNTRRTFTIAIGVVALLCLSLICVAGIAYWQFGDQILGLLGLAPQIRAASMMPADTPLYMGLSLNLQNQAGYQNLKKIYFDNPDVQKGIDELLADFEGDTSINFKEDIQPWLGTEAGLALSNITDLEDLESAEILIAVATRDVEASQAFLQKLRDQAAVEDGRPFKEGDYQGLTYWFQPAESDFESSTYTAILDDFVLVTSSEAALFGAVDRAKSKGESLADGENFQAVIGALPGNGVFLTFIDWNAIADLALQQTPVELEPAQLAQVKALKGIGMAATLQPNGVQIDTAIRIDMEKLSESTRAAFGRATAPNQILNRIPAGAIGFVSSNDLKGVWQQVRDGLATNPDFEQQLKDLEDEIGLDLDEDIFGWMNGEYCLVMTEAQPPDEFAPPLGAYLLIGTDDVALAQAKVAKLVDVINQELFLEFEGGTVGGHAMQVIVDPASESIMGGYGFWDNFFVTGYLEDALAAAFAAGGAPITNSAHFKSVSERLPDNNYGYIYVDIDAVQRLVEGEMTDAEQEEYEANVRPFIEPLRAFGAASGMLENDIQKFTMFLLIAEP